MRIEAKDTRDFRLESLRPAQQPDWMLAISGYWREDQFHSGHIAYYLACIGPGDWILDGVERNAILDDVTQEDVDAGRLDDDQIQAMWGMTLEEAQDAEYRQIVAVCLGADAKLAANEIATALYRAACKAGAKEVIDPDRAVGLIAR